jgi:ubiquinone/menaquinone biosynthesis C-methylase UbiE
MFNKLIIKYKRQQLVPLAFSFFLNPLFLLRQRLMKNIKANSSFMKGIMLDLGCGTKPYKSFFDVDFYIGVDVKKSASEYSDEQVDVIYNGKSLPFRDESFDSILCTEVIEHVFEIDKLLKELYRVLKKTSYMLITCPFVYEEHEIPYDFARYTSYGVIYLMEKYGLKVINQYKTTNYVETIIQMWLIYLHQYVFPRNKYLRFLFSLLFIPLLNSMAIILGSILPKNYLFYNNNIILVQKSINEISMIG